MFDRSPSSIASGSTCGSVSPAAAAVAAVRLRARREGRGAPVTQYVIISSP